MTLVLDPESKLTYFKNNWGKELADDVRDAAEKIVSVFISLCPIPVIKGLVFGSLKRGISKCMVRVQLRRGQLSANGATKSLQSFLLLFRMMKVMFRQHPHHQALQSQ